MIERERSSVGRRLSGRRPGKDKRVEVSEEGRWDGGGRRWDLPPWLIIWVLLDDIFEVYDIDIHN